ncbi:hypothetical protein FRC17_009822 [Serendipita sp. 399]|nr:hypothetical protein FRC17_009822 [Serendipita sp. 399]
MAKRKRTLKAALGAHQTKMRGMKQIKAMEAQKEMDIKSKTKRTKSKASNSGKTRKSIIPYTLDDTILLVGEGDFSFTLSLIRFHGIPPEHITATAFDSETMCYEKYPWCPETVMELRTSGVNVLFRVDATKLISCKSLKGKRFTKVVFNFPHAGKGITDQDRNILSNQELLLNFLKSAPDILATGAPNTLQPRKRDKPEGESEQESEGDDEIHVSIKRDAPQASRRGTVLITLRDSPPYTLWDVPKLAKRPAAGRPRYIQLRSFAFDPAQYPGYSHRRTAGHRGEKERPVVKERDGVVDARTWQYELAS